MNNGSNALSIYYSWKYTTKNNTYDIVRNIRIKNRYISWKWNKEIEEKNYLDNDFKVLSYENL